MGNSSVRNNPVSGRWIARAGLWTVFFGAICLGSVCSRPSGVEETKSKTDIQALFPRQGLLSGWRTEDEPKLYSGNQLYEYINGGADLYLEYGFDQAATLEYKGPDDAVIIVDIYRMASPRAAYGIFSVHSGMKYTPVLDVGTIGALTPYQFTFCKGEYFVAVQALEEGEEADRSLDYFARLVDSRISGADTAFPALVRELPSEGLLPQSVTLVHGVLGLNSRRYLGDENHFALGGDTWGVLGLYRLSGDTKKPALLLLVDYPDSAEAARVFGQVNSRREKLLSGAAVSDDSSSPGPGRYDQGPLIETRGNRLAACFDLPAVGVDEYKKLLNKALSY